jgi:hypothetical protein
MGSKRNSAKTMAAPIVPWIPGALPNRNATKNMTLRNRNGRKLFKGVP